MAVCKNIGRKELYRIAVVEIQATQTLVSYRKLAGLSHLDPKKRTCLKCSHAFPSHHAGNRVCPYCKYQQRRTETE